MYTKRANVRRIWECVSCVLVVGVGGGVVMQKCKHNIKKNNVKFVLKLSKMGAMQKVSDSDSGTCVIF